MEWGLYVCGVNTIPIPTMIEDIILPPHIEERNGAYFNTLNQRWVGDYKIKKICIDYWANEGASPVIPTGDGTVVFKKDFTAKVKTPKKQGFKSAREVSLHDPIIIPEAIPQKQQEIHIEKEVVPYFPAQEEDNPNKLAWKGIAIPGYEHYFADENGYIYSDHNWRGEGYRIVKPVLASDGYLKVRLSLNGKRLNRKLHHLIAITFKGPKPVGKQVRHLNGDRFNCAASNIEWGTPQENADDRDNHGTTARGVSIISSKLYNEDVLQIKSKIIDGETDLALSELFKVSRRNINQIRNGKSWKHI